MKKIVISILFVSLFLMGCKQDQENVKSTVKESASLQKENETTPIKQESKVLPKKSVSQSEQQTNHGIELGIESIKQNKDGSVDINIYMTNSIPVAGFQFEFVPGAIFQITGISGGIGEELGFMMNGKNKKALGFSMQGTQIPITSSSNIEDNILCTVTAELLGDPKGEILVDLEPIIAGKKGAKLAAVTIPFNWKIK